MATPFQPNTCSRFITALLALSVGAFSGTLALADPVAGENAVRTTTHTQQISRVPLTSTHTYLRELIFSCSANTCSSSVPAPGAGNQLTLNRISCFMAGPAGVPFRNGLIELFAPPLSHVLYQNFTAASSDGTGAHVINSEISVYARGGQTFGVSLLVSSGTATFATCTLAGTIGPIP